MSSLHNRPARDLTPYPLDKVLPVGAHPPMLLVTMGEGQWDDLLRQCYDAGWVLLEVDDNEQPVRAYRKTSV